MTTVGKHLSEIGNKRKLLPFKYRPCPRSGAVSVRMPIYLESILRETVPADKVAGVVCDTWQAAVSVQPKDGKPRMLHRTFEILLLSKLDDVFSGNLFKRGTFSFHCEMISVNQGKSPRVEVLHPLYDALQKKFGPRFSKKWLSDLIKQSSHDIFVSQFESTGEFAQARGRDISAAVENKIILFLMGKNIKSIKICQPE